MSVYASHRGRSAKRYTDAMLAQAAELGFAPPAVDEIPAAREMTVKLMDHEVATLTVFEAVLAIQPASILIYRAHGDIRGVTATLLLRPAVLPLVTSGGFDGMDFDLEYLSRPDEAPAIYYVWGIAGATKTASGAVMALSKALRYHALADLPAYALAATPVGRHVGVTQLGFQGVRSSDDNLVVSPAVLRERAA